MKNIGIRSLVLSLSGVLFALGVFAVNVPKAGAVTCVINTFYASPSSVSFGGSTTLFWDSSGCQSLSLSNMGTVSPTGSTTIGSLYGSTYYTLTATDPSGIQISKQLFVGVTSYNPGGNCYINSFTANPVNVPSGQSTTLSWNTSGCSSVTLSGGSFYGQYEPATGSVTTGAIYGTTNFTINASGGTSTSASTTVYATNSPYPYSYNCQNSYRYYDPSCSSQYASSFVTTPAWNISATSAQLAGLYTGNTPGLAYFEYGTSTALGSATPFQNVSSYNSSTPVSDTIRNLRPNTTYYYRISGQINGVIVHSNVMSFLTLMPDSTLTFVGSNEHTGGTSAGTVTFFGGTTTPAPSAVTVTVQGKDAVSLGDTIDDTVTWTNGTKQTLTDATLVVTIPQGYLLKQTNRGTMTNPTTVTVPIGTLAPGQSDSAFIEATVGPNTPVGQTLLTNATLTYTLPSGAHDSAVGYVLSHASVPNALAGFAFGSGFFPTTLFGWMITAIIILVIILLARRIAKAKKAGHGHGHDAGHGGHH